MSNFTPTTKRLIISSLGMVAIVVGIGWAVGKIEAADAMLPIGMIITGFMALLKGGE